MNKLWKFSIIIFVLFFMFSCNGGENDQHQHQFIEGKCECGEVDSNYQEHVHEFVDGECSCGEVDPNYEELIDFNNLTVEVLGKIVENMQFVTSTSTNLSLPKYFVYQDHTINITWRSNHTKIISHSGSIIRTNEDRIAELKATFEYNGVQFTKIYEVTVLKYSELERLNVEVKNFNLPLTFSSGFELPMAVKDTDIEVSWKSSHPDIIDQDGTKEIPYQLTEVTLTLVLKLNDEVLEKEFVMSCFGSQELRHPEYSTAVHDYNDFSNGTLINLFVNENNQLEMSALEGEYLSPIYIADFTEIVGSWSAISSKETGTVELQYRVLVDGVWSDYVSYGAWKLGDKSYSKTKTTADKLVEIDLDIISVLNGKTASAYQYKVTFKRTEEQTSPLLRLVGSALDLGLSDVDVNVSSDHVEYDVPMLNQNIVPGIGNSICSPTSTTMLLKYFGHDFSDMGYTYEHEYMAHAVYDFGASVYGNWTYNVAVMGAYGEYAYVKRFTGPNDLINHLEQIGPVALSVKGNMQGYYTTAGHLLVCKGYKIVDGEYIFICNDPNLKNVEVEYTYETIANVWRNIAYVIENVE